MAYSPTTDFLALIRNVGGAASVAEMPGLDYVVAAMARAGLFRLSVGQTAPTVNQAATAWLQPAQPSWTAEGILWLWDADVAAYALATPALFSQLLALPSHAWVPYTPVLSAASGALTSASATGRYRIDGSTVFFEVTAKIVTNGTASGSFNASLPVVSGPGHYVVAGRENFLTGKMLLGIVWQDVTQVLVYNYDNTYPGVDGTLLIFSGVYESG